MGCHGRLGLRSYTSPPTRECKSNDDCVGFAYKGSGYHLLLTGNGVIPICFARNP